MEQNQFDNLPEVPIRDGQSLLQGIVYDDKDRPIGRWNHQQAGDVFNSISWREFSAIEFPPQEWIIKGLIPHQGIVIIASPSGEKKTWIAMEMARAVATGTNFLNSDHFIVKKGKVLYINQEMAQSEFQRRGILLGFGDAEDLILVRRDLNLNSSESANELLEFIRKENINFIIIDTFRPVAGGLKEEKAEEIRAFFDRFKPLKDEGRVVMFLDHCRKPARHEGKTPRKEQLFASQDKVSSVEILLMLRSEPRSNDIYIYHVKNRLGREVDPFKIQMVDEIKEGKDLVRLNYEGLFEEKESKVDEAMKLIPELLQEGGKFTHEIIDVGFSEWDIGEKNIRNALTALKESGKITGKRAGRELSYSLPESDPGPADLFDN